MKSRKFCLYRSFLASWKGFPVNFSHVEAGITLREGQTQIIISGHLTFKVVISIVVSHYEPQIKNIFKFCHKKIVFPFQLKLFNLHYGSFAVKMTSWILRSRYKIQQPWAIPQCETPARKHAHTNSRMALKTCQVPAIAPQICHCESAFTHPYLRKSKLTELNHDSWLLVLKYKKCKGENMVGQTHDLHLSAVQYFCPA